MKREITHELKANEREQLDFLAQCLGKDSFFIQDTETTGVDELDQIHDFAGLYYDKGKVYKIQYYVVQPNDRDENGVIHVDFNALRKINKGSPAFQYMMGTDQDSNAAYRKMREAMDKKVWDENDPMISRENLAKLLRDRYAKVPNFTYNAIFDIEMEKKLESAINSKIKFNEVYDVMGIALSTMPEIMSAKMGKELGTGKLEKVYKYLSDNYPEFAKFKTSSSAKQQHTAWSDIFEYTVPVLNFFLQELYNRGCDIRSFKNIQLFYHSNRHEQMERIIKNEMIIGVDLSHFLSQNNMSPRLVAGAIGSQNILALQEMAINNQMIGMAIKGSEAAVKTETVAAQSQVAVIEDQIAAEKEEIRNLQAQKNRIKKTIGANPSVSFLQRPDIQKRIDIARKNIIDLEKGRNKYLKRIKELKSSIDILQKAAKENTQDKILKGLELEITKADKAKDSIKKRIDSYVDETLKKYNGTRLGTAGVVWDSKTSSMRFLVQGKEFTVQLPDWWVSAQRQRVDLERKATQLRTDLANRKTSMGQSAVAKKIADLQRYEQKLITLDKNLEQQRRKVEQKDYFLRERLGSLLKMQRNLVNNSKDGKYPPAYYNNKEKIQNIEEQLRVFSQYDDSVSKLAGVEGKISRSKEQLKQLKKKPEETKTIVVKEKTYQIGITQNGKMAYFLNANGTLGRRVPESIWNSSKGELRTGIDLDSYRPSKKEFKFVSSKAALKDDSLLNEDMTIIPLKMGLYTGVTSAGKGYVFRAHESRLLDPEEFLRFGKSKIFSVTELSSTIGKWFGRDSNGVGWKTEFGTAHHKVLEDIFNGKLKRKNDGTVDTNELKKYLIKSWINGDAETRADLRAIFVEGGGSKVSDAAFSVLTNTVNSTLKMVKSARVPDEAMLKGSELTLGALMNLNGNRILVSGTLDQLWKWGNELRIADFKTSQEVGPDYVIQLSLYNALVRALGPETLKKYGISEVSSKMTIWLTPSDKKKVGDIIDIKGMNDRELASFVNDSWTVLNEKNSTRQQQLVSKLKDKWFSRVNSHIGRRLIDAEVETEYGLETRHFINGQSLGDIGEELNKRFKMSKQESINFQNYLDSKTSGHNKNLTYEEFLRKLGKKRWDIHVKSVKARHDAVRQYINSLTSVKDREHVKHLLFMRGEDNQFLYDNPIFEDYRSLERSELYNITTVTKRGIETVYQKGEDDKMHAVKVKVKAGEIKLNEEWLKNAGAAGVSASEGTGASLGNLSTRDWINLFKSVDLSFLYHADASVNTITKFKNKTLAVARKRGQVYIEAVEKLSKMVLDGFNNGTESWQKAEEFLALKKFLNSINATLEHQKDIGDNFLPTLNVVYENFIKEHKDLRNYDMRRFVREHSDLISNAFSNGKKPGLTPKEIKDKFNLVMDVRAASQLAEVPGMGSLFDLVDLSLNERPEVISKSFEKLSEHLGRNIDENEHLSKTEFQLQREQEIEELASKKDSSFTEIYDKYVPEKRATIMAQLPHRIARMLTRQALGDIVYKGMYEEFKKLHKKSALTYKDFIDSLPKEQRNEYYASKMLNDKLNAALKTGDAGKFLVSLAKETSIGVDTESKNLLSLIKSIAQESPDILTDSQVLHSLTEQVNGAKMLHYGNFSADKLARLGLPLTMIGKELDLNKKRSPYTTFERQNAKLLEALKSGEIGNLRKKFTALLQDTSNSEKTFDDLMDFIFYFNGTIKKYRKAFSMSEALSEKINIFNEYNTELIKLAPSEEDIREKTEDELAENANFRSSILTKRIQILADFEDFFNLVSFFKNNLLGVGERNGDLIGRQAVISILNAEVEAYNKKIKLFSGEETKELIKDLKQEVGSMAKNNTEHLLQQIVDLLSGKAAPVGNILPQAVGGSAVESFSVFEKPTQAERTARQMAIEEHKLEQEIIKRELRLAESGGSDGEDELRSYRQRYNKLREENNKYAKGTSQTTLLKQQREDVRKEFEEYQANSLYSDIFKTYVGNEIKAKEEVDKIIGQIRAAEEKKQTQVADFLENTLLPSAQQKYDFATGQKQAFLDQHTRKPGDKNYLLGSFDDRFLGELSKIEQEMYSSYQNGVSLADARREDNERLTSETNYLKLIEEEITLKKQLTDVNIKIKETDPASIELKELRAQKRELRAKELSTKTALGEAYESYAARYGTSDGVFMSNGEEFLKPGQAVSKVSRENKRRKKAAEQDAAIKEYNNALKEQYELNSKIFSLEEKIRTARRGGDNDTVALLEGQLAGASGERLASGKRVASAMQGLRGAFGNKMPRGLRTVSDNLSTLVADHGYNMSKQEFADYKSAVREYIDLKKREMSLTDQLHRNDLKYKTTYNQKERGALDVQGSLIGMDLSEVQDKLAKIGQSYKDVKGFATKKAEFDKAFDDLQNKNIANANVAFKGENTLFGKLTTSFKGMLYQFTQFGAAYKILGAVKQGISNVVASAKNLDKALTDLRIVTGQSGSEAKNTMQRFAELGSQLGVTTNEVAKSATAWLRQGYDMAQVTDLVTSSMYLSKLGMISVDEATQGLTSTLKGFKLEAREAMDVVDKFTALDVKAATTAGEIATGLAQFANLASMSGVSVDQASAMVATIADVSQVSGAQAGNSLKMMLSRYGTVKSGKFSSMEGEGDTEALNDVEKVLTKIGISMRDTNGQFKEFDQVLDEIAEKWGNLDNISQAAIATAVAGTRQREAFLVLMENMDKYRSFTEISEGSKGTAEKKYQSYQEQLQAAQNRLAAAWERIAQDADIASFITVFVNFATSMVKHLPTLLKTVTRLIAIWQGYKIPTLLQQGANFTGLTPLFNTAKGLFKKGGIGSAIKKGNQSVYDYVNGETNRFGGGLTDRLLQQIYDKVAKLTGDVENGESDVQENAEAVEQASEDMANNAADAAADKATENQLGKQNVDLKEGETAENAKQLLLTQQETQIKSSGKGIGAYNYAGKGGGKVAAAAIASGAAGIISGIMTTGSTHKSIATGQSVESSAEASGAMKGVSAGVNALGMIGYIWGPIGGMIGQTIASVLDGFLTPFLGKWIDADRDARSARVEEAQKQLSSLEAIQSAVSNIESTVSSKAMTYEENQQLISQMKELKETLLENIDVTKQLASSMGVTSQDIFNKINDWARLSSEERQDFVTAIQAVLNSKKSNATLAAAEEELHKLQEKAKDYQLVYDFTHETPTSDAKEKGHREAYDIFKQWMQENGVDAEYKENYEYYLGSGWQLESGKAKFTADGEKLIRQYKSFIDFLTKTDAEKYSSIITEYQGIIRDYEAQLAAVNEIYKEANEYLTAAALLTAKISIPTGGSVNLLTATSAQLKQAGKDKIREAVVQELLANGGFRGYSVDSKEGQAIIEQAIKSNEKLYAVWTGQIYTLNEALNTQNTEVLKSFATALGVSVDKLGDLKDELGDLRLSDILGSPADTRTKISELTSLFTSMASSSGMTAENLESIINKFPELIVNLKDSVSLGGSMLNMLDQYNALYSRQVLSDLLNNEDYFEQMMKELEKRSPDAYNDFIHNSKYRSATNVQGILGLLTEEYKEGSGISKETYDMLKSIYGEYFDFTVQSSLGTEAFEAYVSYWNKIWDKQISNLEEQKSAIQEITKQREYENKLIEARLRLENASKEKKRVYREGVGWVYEADQNAVKEAQENLEQVQREQTISELEQQIKELNYLKERLSQITENKELENLESLWKSFLGDESIKELMSEYSVVDILDGKYGNITEIVLRGVDALENYVDAKESSYSGVFGDSGSAWSELVAARDKMNGISDKGSKDYYDAQTAYNTALHTYQSQASAYQSQYGSEEGWDNNLTQEQKDALTLKDSDDAYGTLMISKGGKDVKFRTDEEISPLNNADVYNDLQEAAKGARPSGNEGTQLETWKYTPGTTLDVDSKGSIVSGKTFRDSFGSSLESWATAAIADHPQGVVFAKDDDHSKLGIAVGEGYLGAKKSGMYELKTARKGSLGLGGGPTLINEEGTEAIITPGGTLTSLPSGTGVVPADITRSLWQLGELAPSILRVLGYNGGGQFAGGSGIVNNSDSVNIGSVIMQVSADAGFDPERFVEELKTQAALSKNNRR